MGKTVRASWLLVAGIVLAACGAPVEVGPSDLATPDILWEGGEPSGPLESDPWVRAVRASELNRALAVNAHDFSDPDLWNTRDHSLVEEQQTDAIDSAESDPDGPTVVLAPVPFDPVRVEVDPSGERANVVVCRFNRTWVSLQDMAVDEGAEWNFYAYEVVRGDDGHLRAGQGSLPQDILDQGTGVGLLECEPSQRSIGWFDPAPVVTPFGPEDVVMGVRPGETTQSPGD